MHASPHNSKGRLQHICIYSSTASDMRIHFYRSSFDLSNTISPVSFSIDEKKKKKKNSFILKRVDDINDKNE